MTKNEIIKFFSLMRGSELCYPFDETSAVYKVGGKMFGIIGTTDGYTSISLKGQPEDNYALRSMFESIIPGYHLNKEHWNTLIIDGTLEDGLVKRLIGESYEIVFNKLAKKLQKEIINKF